LHNPLPPHLPLQQSLPTLHISFIGLQQVLFMHMPVQQSFGLLHTPPAGTQQVASAPKNWQVAVPQQYDGYDVQSPPSGRQQRPPVQAKLLQQSPTPRQAMPIPQPPGPVPQVLSA
jgi:hypothetical protein